MKTVAGVPLGMVRDAANGHFAAHAIGVALDPLAVSPQMIMQAGQLYQGYQTLQGIKVLINSMATLQSTVDVIGLGTGLGVGIGFVNLWQTLKLRQEVNQMRIEVKEGFIDLKQMLSGVEVALTNQIQQVSKDVEFNTHRIILARAYRLFEKAMNRLQSAMKVQDPSRRSAEIGAARDMMFTALADYSNSHLMSGAGSAAYLRRRECVWVIEQAIAMTYQMQGEWHAVSDRLTELSAIIRQDLLATLDKRKTSDELDFLFPEVLRIRDHDLVALEAWNAHATWYPELSREELKQLDELSCREENQIEDSGETEEITDCKPIEYTIYEKAKSKFVPEALHKSLVYSLDASSRQQGEDYITKRANSKSSTAFSAQNLKNASSLAIANLELHLAL